MDIEAFLRIKNGKAVGEYKIVESNTKRRYHSTARARILDTILGSSAFYPETEEPEITEKPKGNPAERKTENV